MSIIDGLRGAIYALNDLPSWLVNVSTFVTFQSVRTDPSFSLPPEVDPLKFVQDAERFVLHFFNAISQSVPHIYIYNSAPPLSPTSFITRARYTETQTEVKCLNTIHTTWDSCTRSIPAFGVVAAITFSHKEDLIAAGDGGPPTRCWIKSGDSGQLVLRYGLAGIFARW